MTSFAVLDWVVIALYFAIPAGIAIWVMTRKQRSSADRWKDTNEFSHICGVVFPAFCCALYRGELSDAGSCRDADYRAHIWIADRRSEGAESQATMDGISLFHLL